MRHPLSLALSACLLAAPALAQAAYQSQLIEVSKAWGSVVADFNGDGHDDLFITGHDKADKVWFWTPTGYQASAQTLPWVDRHDCDVADVNRDGRLDMFCAVGAEGGFGDAPKELWLLGADGLFQAAQAHGAEDRFGRGRYPVFFDFNADGWPDLYLANESSTRPDGEINHNHVFVNQRTNPPSFAEATTLATGRRGSACAAKGDVNGDGWDDLLVCDYKGPPHVYMNDRAGNFTELATPAVAAKWRDARLADMNADGRLDLLVLTTTDLLQVWLNTGSGTFFETVAYQNKFNSPAKSITTGDFNRDGRADIYAVLQQAGCQDVDQDTVNDLMFHGRAGGGFIKLKMTETYAGCGHRADTVDGHKVLLMQGDEGTRSPNYLIEKVPAAQGR